MATKTKKVTDAAGSQNYVAKSGESLTLKSVQGEGGDKIYLQGESKDYTVSLWTNDAGNKVVNLFDAATGQKIKVEFPSLAAGGSTSASESIRFLDGGVKLFYKVNADGTISVKFGDQVLTDGAGPVAITAVPNPDYQSDIAFQPYNLTVDNSAASVYEGNSGTTQMTFTLTLDRAPLVDTTVNYKYTDQTTATPGVDFVDFAPGSIVFAAGEKTATFSITVNGDTTVEPDESIKVKFSGANLAAPVSINGWILNDDNADPVFDNNGVFTFSVPEDRAVGYVVGTAAATDANDADTLTYSINPASDPRGFFAINPATGQITLTDSASFNYESGKTSYVLDVKVTDGHGGQDMAQVTVDITNVNEPVSFVADPYAFDVQQNVDAGMVVGQVMTVDPDMNDTVAYAITAGNDSGYFSVDANGDIVVTDAGVGNLVAGQVYTLTVQATDGGIDGAPTTDAAQVTITIGAIDNPPVFDQAQYNFVLPENENANTVIGTAAATDDGASVAYAITAGNDAGYFAIDSTGAISLTRTGADNWNYEGAANSFPLTVTATDSIGQTTSVPVTVAISNVNEAPVAARDTSLTTAEDTALSGSLTGYVTDPDAGDTLTYAPVDGSAVGGSVAVQADGSFVFTPDANFNGRASFDYMVTDAGGLSDKGSVAVNVTPVNDAPVLAPIDPVTVDQGQPVTIVTSATDPENDPLTYGVAAQPLNGTVTSDDKGSFTYTPNPTFIGTDVFTVSVSDGIAAPVTQTVTVTSVVPPSYELSTGGVDNINETGSKKATTVTYTLTTTGVAEGTQLGFTVGGVQPEDVKVDGAAAGGPLTGVLTVAADGTATATVQAVADNITEGPETMTFTLDNGAAAPTVTINDTSMAPPVYAVSSDVTSVDEGSTITYTLTTQNVLADTKVAYDLSGTGITATDVIGGLTGEFVVGADGTATVSVVVRNDQTTEGQESVVLTLTGTDPVVAAAPVTINDTSLTPNAAPTISGNTAVTDAVAGNPSALPDVVFADADTADTLTVTVTATNGTVTGLTDADPATDGIQLTGTQTDVTAAFAAATYTPAGVAAGTGSVGLSVSDGVNAPVTGDISVTFAASNALPTISGATAVTTAMAGVASALPDVAFADADSASLTVTVTATNGALSGLTDADPATAGIQLTGTPAQVTAAFAAATYTPAGTAAGTGTVDLSVSDGVNAPVTGSIPVTFAANGFTVVQLDGQGSASGSVTLADASTGMFNFVDGSTSVAENVVIPGFGADDQLTFTGITSTQFDNLFSVSTDGAGNVTFLYNDNGALNSIELMGVVTPGSFGVSTLAGFNALSVGDVVFV